MTAAEANGLCSGDPVAVLASGLRRHRVPNPNVGGIGMPPRVTGTVLGHFVSPKRGRMVIVRLSGPHGTSAYGFEVGELEMLGPV